MFCITPGYTNQNQCRNSVPLTEINLGRYFFIIQMLVYLNVIT